MTASASSRTSRTVLVTGATDGLGRALALDLAAGGAALVLHGRNRERLDRLADEVAATGAPTPRTVLADFAELDQVRRMAAEVRDGVDRLDVLVNNAGIGGGEPDGVTRRTSADGYELRFAVNHLAGFLLTLELLPLLRASAPARVVNVASLGQHPIDFEDPQLTKEYEGARAYRQSKLAQIMTAFHLAERVPAREVAFTCLHPGTYMPTKLVRDWIGRSVDTVESGVAATRRLAVGADVAGVTGRFFDRTEDARAHAQAYDEAARECLWELSLRLTGAPRHV